ncbi:MAG: Dabb family protein [Microbacteriaceae bacterium]|nr:Dabb family protein [Microbacteriaceae bacterium]
MAIIHIVLIEWAEEMAESEREDTRAIARAMSELIPGIDRLNEGPSVSVEGLEQGHNYALVVRFPDERARARYLPHPAHQKFVDKVREHSVAVTVFDLEIES